MKRKWGGSEQEVVKREDEANEKQKWSRTRNKEEMGRKWSGTRNKEEVKGEINKVGQK